ncbi:MAG: hypothetical protein ABIS06_22405 [Vicinamibacterales bacterium]
MKLRIFALTLLLALLQLGSRAAGEIQKADPHRIPATQVLEAVRMLTTYAEVGLPAEDVISGDRTFDGTVMAANILTFARSGQCDRPPSAPASGGLRARIAAVAAKVVVAGAVEHSYCSRLKPSSRRQRR